MRRNCSKNQVVCARCHLVGLASGIDCTAWASALKGAARCSVSARTVRKRSRHIVRRSFGGTLQMIAGSPSSDGRRRADDEVAGGMPCPGLEKTRWFGEKKRIPAMLVPSLYVNRHSRVAARGDFMWGRAGHRQGRKNSLFSIMLRPISRTVPLPCPDGIDARLRGPWGRPNAEARVGRARCRGLFRGPRARRRGHAVLLPGAAARADRTDDLAVHGDRDAAFGGDRRCRKGHEGGIAGGELVREDFGGATVHGGGAGLALGDLGRRHLGAVHLLKIDDLARRADDRERHAPVVLLGLGEGGGGDRLGLLIGDRRAVIGRGGRRRRGRRLLRQGGAAEGHRGANAEQDQQTSSHGPVSTSVWGRGVTMSRWRWWYRHDVVENSSSLTHAPRLQGRSPPYDED